MANVKLDIQMDSSKVGTSNYYDPTMPSVTNKTLKITTDSPLSNNNVGFATNINALSEQEYAMFVLRKIYELLSGESSETLTDEQVLEELCTIFDVTYDASSFTNTFNNIYVAIIGSQPSGNIETDVNDLLEFYNIETIGIYEQIIYNNFNGTDLLTWQGEQGVLYFNKDKLLSTSKTGVAGKLSSEQTRRQFVFKRNLENDEFSITFTLSVNSSNPQLYFKKIIIKGDSIANQFPIEAIIDGTKTIYNDDNFWVIAFDSQEITHTIKFTKWNKTNYNAVINSIVIMYDYYSIDNYNGLTEITNLSQSTSNPDIINYGVISSNGRASIIDINGEIQDLIKDGVIEKSNVPIVFSIKNKPVSYGLIQDSSYNETKEYSISINNQLDYLENITFSCDYKDDFYSLYSLMIDVFGRFVLDMYNVADINSFLDNENEFVYYGEGIKTYLQSIMLDSAYMPETTVRDALNKVCTIAQINIFLDNNNKLNIVNARPKFSPAEKIIKIPRRNQYSDLQYDLTVGNVFDGVAMSEYQVSSEIKTNVAVYQVETEDTFDLTTITSTILNTTSSSGSIIAQREFSSYNVPLSVVTRFGFLYVRDYYNSIGTITIPKKTNSNLSRIVSVSTSTAFKDGQPIYRVLYKKRVFPCSCVVTISSTNISNYSEKQSSGVVSGSGNFTTEVSYNYGGDVVSLEINDNSSLTVTQVSGNYVIGGNILSARQVVAMDGGGFSGDATQRLDGTRVDYEPVGLQITLYGDTETIWFEAKDVSTTNIDYAKNKVNIIDNILINQNTTFEGTRISESIKSNIINDYSDGIRTAKIKINPDDYYDINNNLVKDWRYGDLIYVGDVVRVDKDNNDNSVLKYNDNSDYYWRVTGVQYNYDGESLMDLQLIEVKRGLSGYGLYSNDNVLISDWFDLIDNGLITVLGTTLTKVDTSLEGKLKIYDNISIIAASACKDCIKLSTVTLPKNITTIGDYAFYGCTSLYYIYYNKLIGDWLDISFGIDWINSSWNLYIDNSLFVVANISKSIKDYAFCYCNSITDVDIKDNSTSIGKYAFNNCSNLKVLKVGSQVKYIGTQAFNNCIALRIIDWDAEEVTNYDRTAFRSPNSNSMIGLNIYINKNVKVLPTFFMQPSTNSAYCPKVIGLVFDSSSICTTINYGAFTYIGTGASALSITLPSSLYSINREAFSNANISAVTFESTINWNVNKDDTTPPTIITINPSTSTSSNATYLTNTYSGFVWTRVDHSTE